MTSAMKWDPFKDLRDKLQLRTEDEEAERLSVDDVEPDADQGQQTTEPAPKLDMNDFIRAAVGVRTPRDRRDHRIPEIGDGD